MNVKTYTPQELKDIIENHRKYLAGESTGQRADLYGANLRDCAGQAYIRAEP